MRHIAADIRVAVRSLSKSPGFSAASIVTMAVAIGATTAIFSVFDRLVLNPVAIPDPSTLVAIWFNNPQRNVQAPAISVPRYDEIVASTQSFSLLAASAGDTFTLTGDSDPVQLNALRVTASFFTTLGVVPARGRNFLASEDTPNGPSVCILSHEFWQAQFGGRGDVVGSTIQLDGKPWQVIGVMPPALTAPFGQVQIFAPRIAEVSYLTPQQIQNGATFFQPMGRLKPGVTLEQARAELAAFSAGYKQRYPSRLDANNLTYPRRFVDALVSGFAPSMYALIGAVACVLLIACANAASLFLNRLLGRRKEIAVRMSIGAARGVIVRQFMVEALVFCLAAGVLGAVLARWSLAALASVVSSQLPPNTPLTLNWRVLAFSGLVTLVTAVLTGLVPSLQASRADLVEHLKDGARGTSAGSGGRLRQALIVSEVMFSVVLLVGSSLLLVTFMTLQRTALGFETSGIASATVGLAPARYRTPAQQTQFYDEVIAKLRANGTVTSAAAAIGIPLGGYPRTPYGVGGRPLPPLGDRPIMNFDVVTDDYFSLFGLRILEGRGFTPDDRATSPPVCLITEALSKRLFQGRSPLGETILIGKDGQLASRIIGVVSDARDQGAVNPVPDEAFYSLRQRPSPAMNVVARTTGDPAALQTAIKSAVAAVDRNQSISFFATLESTAALSLGAQRLVATLTSIFAGLALVLALIGLYSVIAYGVSQRTNEIGIRMALGASRRAVVGLVMRGGLMLVAIGLVLGLAGSIAAGRLMRQLLFGVPALNVAIYAGVAAAFVAVACLACLGPSLRASRIDPLTAVRES
jgi:predicted permease